MIKTKVSMKEVKATHTHVIQIGYCALQNLLRCEAAWNYTSGVYGWNADVYSYGSIAIVTGYRPFGDIIPRYETVKKYETKAQQKIDSWRDRGVWDYEKREKELRKIIDSFLREVTK